MTSVKTCQKSALPTNIGEWQPPSVLWKWGERHGRAMRPEGASIRRSTSIYGEGALLGQGALHSSPYPHRCSGTLFNLPINEKNQTHPFKGLNPSVI